MLGIYLSGTGNTKHCVEKLVRLLSENATLIPLEDDGVVEAIKADDTINMTYSCRVRCDMIHT